MKRLSALPFARRIGKEVDRAAEEAKRSGAGLLHSEQFLFSFRHFGVLQYWRSFDELEAWSRGTSPHAGWWKQAVERGRTKGDFALYHETFLVPRENIETIYVDCPFPAGLLAFGDRAEATGGLTASRDRLGRRAGRPS